MALRSRHDLRLGLLLLAGCGGAGAGESDRVLDYGDAEWARPPFDPPGGNGEKSGDDSWGGDAGSASAGEDGGADGWGTGYDSGYDSSSGDDGASSSSGGSEGTGSSGGSESSSGSGSSDGSGGSSSGGAAPLLPAPGANGDAPACPATMDPVVLYMSNDDSNSQASPILARRAIRDGGIVDPFRVRIHEFLNYYDMSYENPEDTPADVGLQMRRINPATGEFVLLAYAQGRAIDPATRPAMNLVFSLDTSGSMSGERMELLQETMRAIAGSLRADDVVSIVTWSDLQEVPLDSYVVQGADDPTLVGVIDGLEAGGSTDLHTGLVLAYQLAQSNYGADRINRVVLISDGGANTGVTDIDLIAAAAGDSDGEGVYMVGVGVGDAQGYTDDLMDAVTDAGKGAYVFIDRPEEAERMFGERFVQNTMVAARNVRMELTMPWYFALTEFHGEEYSADPEEVDPQHLAPNDAMSYHQIVQACDPEQIFIKDTIKAKVTYEDPIDHSPATDDLEIAIGEIVQADAAQLYKGDVVVAYAQSLVVIGDHWAAGNHATAIAVAQDMVGWLQAAVDALGDAEIVEMRDLMQEYATSLELQG